MKFFISLFLLLICGISPVFAVSVSAPAQASEIDPSDLDKIETVRWLYHRKEYKMAENILNELFDKSFLHPTIHSKALLLLANIAKETNRLPEALVFLQIWRTRFPGSNRMPRVNLMMGRIYRDMKSYDRAREFFYLTLSSLVVTSSRKDQDPVSLKKDKRFSQVATWEIAETEYQAGRWQKANALFERFKKQNTGVEDLVQASLYRQGDCLYQMGDFDKALNAYQTALAVGPFHPFAAEAWLRLIDIYGRQNDYIQQKQAIEAFIWIVKEMYPNDMTYWQERCASVLLQFAKEKPDEAQALLAVLQVNEPNTSWKNISEYLQQLTSRTFSNAPPEKIHGDENWVEWYKKVSQENTRLRESLEAMED